LFHLAALIYCVIVALAWLFLVLAFCFDRIRRILHHMVFRNRHQHRDANPIQQQLLRHQPNHQSTSCEVINTNTNINECIDTFANDGQHDNRTNPFNVESGPPIFSRLLPIKSNTLALQQQQQQEQQQQ